METNYEIARARNPEWVDANHNMINLDVDLVPIDEEWLPYTCSPTDVVAHSRELYRRAVTGEFGEIADETPRPEEDLWTPVTTEKVSVSKEALVQVLLEKGVLTDEEVDSILTTSQETLSYQRRTLDGANKEWAGS
jgi:hypothetical protein